jgi:4-hydroxy-tetrahydrodipicolinate reductase
MMGRSRGSDAANARSSSIDHHSRSRLPLTLRAVYIRRHVAEKSMSDMRLIVAGAGGRMGRTLVKAIAETTGLALAGAVEDARSPLIGQDAGVLAGLPANGIALGADARLLLAKADAIVDFTAPQATIAFAALAAEAGKSHIIGTTGLAAADEAKIKDAARKAVIVKSGNMSLGVNLLAALAKRVAKALDDEFDIEILEIHHNKKVDAPSGTALLLGRAAAEGRNINLDQRSVRAREGHTGARRPGDIGFAALRGGTVVGEHSVIFAGPAERIELVHKAEDRMIFARGALKAALWARGQKPGLYSMADVLGLNDL